MVETNPNNSPQDMMRDRDLHMKNLRAWGTATPVWAADYIEALEARLSHTPTERGLLASLRTFVAEHARGVPMDADRQGTAVVLIDEAANSMAALSAKMVERVAHAIYCVEADSDDIALGSQEWCERLARAAIAALSAKPADEMVERLLPLMRHSDRCQFGYRNNPCSCAAEATLRNSLAALTPDNGEVG